MIAVGDQFDDVIYTDESTMALERRRKKSYHKRDQPRKMKAIPKSPMKVHMLGGGGGGIS